MKRMALLVALLMLVLAGAMVWQEARGAELAPADARAAMRQGNYKDAYDALAPRVLAAQGREELVEDFTLCLQALNSLGRMTEIDAFREQAAAAHPKDWKFLRAVAQSYLNLQHYGVIISGQFERGNSRNRDGKWVNSLDRDRVRALQLYQQAVEALKEDRAPDLAAAGQLYYQFAQALMLGNSGQEAWRLQTLTDLSALPDYEETNTPYYGARGRGIPTRGAPVDAEGKPVFHRLPPGGWEAAASDGERYRWLLMQAAELSPVEGMRAQLMWGRFLESQFGVQTMAAFARVLQQQGEGDESGPYAVSALKEEETIARLANGIKRFVLPDEFNPIKVYQRIAAVEAPELAVSAGAANDQLARMFENRQQYDRAAQIWQQGIARFGPGTTLARTRALEQTPSTHHPP